MTAPAPEAACPKCGRTRPEGAETCSRCGLVYARWSGQGEGPPGSADPMSALGDEGRRLWAELAEHWEDESRHDSFVKYCSAAGQLPAAGRLYRSRLDQHPADAVATRMQKRIVGMAAALFTPSPAAARAVSRRGWFWWVLIAGALGGLLASLLARALRS